LSAAAVLGIGAPSPAAFATGASWPAFLHGPVHSSFNPGATTITPANAGTLAPVLQWQAPPPQPGEPFTALFASPTVKNGVVYIGSNTGHFYALDEVTGQILW